MQSPRNQPTGPGSRGGHWHEPLFRAGYFAGYRAGQVAYHASELWRMAQRRRTLRLANDRLEVEAEIARQDAYFDRASDVPG